MESLIKGGSKVFKAKGEPDAKESALTTAAQRVEHCEIVGYGCVRTYAKILGLYETAGLLRETLDEESKTDAELRQLPERIDVAADDTDEAPSKRKEKY